MHFREPPKDEVAMMDAIVRDAVWNVYYHAQQLQKAHKVFARATALLKRGNYEFTMQEALDGFEDEQMDDPETPIDWVKGIVGSAAHGVEYHEEALTKSHAVLACAKGHAAARQLH